MRGFWLIDKPGKPGLLAPQGIHLRCEREVFIEKYRKHNIDPSKSVYRSIVKGTFPCGPTPSSESLALLTQFDYARYHVQRFCPSK